MFWLEMDGSSSLSGKESVLRSLRGHDPLDFGVTLVMMETTWMYLLLPRVNL